jgi:hypothetical protein
VNFCSYRRPWSPFEAVWCGQCYTPHPDDCFHTLAPCDEAGFVWRKDKDIARYRVGRDGDHLVTTFQCDTCIFINLTHRLPLSDSPQDTLTLCCIRRANLDALWGREPSTISSTVSAVSKTLALLTPLGIHPEYPALGPFPVGDQLGYGVAVAMLLKSLEPGRYEAYQRAYQQFETIRKLRSGYHNIYMSSVVGAFSICSVSGDKAK